MWEKEDHVGALIISPTRELTLQIFDVLRLVGRFCYPNENKSFLNVLFL
jgi:superfamily II DNA/RNA helicase